jgi:hypothetical protein
MVCRTRTGTRRTIRRMRIEKDENEDDMPPLSAGESIGNKLIAFRGVS